MADTNTTGAPAGDERPPRDVFCGWTEDDQYTVYGVVYGPGIARDVPAAHADHLEGRVRYVGEKRAAEARARGEEPGEVADPTRASTRPVSVIDASDEELIAALKARGVEFQPAEEAPRAAKAKDREQAPAPPPPPPPPPPAGQGA